MTSRSADSGRSQMVIGTSNERARRVMNKRNHSCAAPPSANHCKGIIMLRSIGSVTFLALFMVGCGGGGGGGASSEQPPPAPTLLLDRRDGHRTGRLRTGAANRRR